MTGNRPARASLPIARQKLFLGALAFSAGILFAAMSVGYRPPLWWMLAAIIFGAAAVLLRSFPRIQSTVALLAIAALAALSFEVSSSQPTQDSSALDGDEAEIVAHVTHDGIARPGVFGSPRQVVELET